MLSLKNVRFEILRDPIVRDFSMDLQPGEVKTLFGLVAVAKRLYCV